MRRARLFAVGIGALILAGCPSATAPHQIGIGGGGAGSRVLAFVIQPAGAIVNTTMSTVQVAVEDTTGAVDATATGGVTLSLTTAAGATLSGTTTQPLASGLSTFTDLSVDLAGTYTLTATSSGRTSATSISFTITP